MADNPAPTKKELQGPRPTPLKVRKDSHKIKKPPLHQPQPQRQPQPRVVDYRPPVIIYTVSPKVIHTDPNDFMTLVQRLTGSSSSSSSSYDYYSNNNYNTASSYRRDGEVSPAARYATIEKAKSVHDQAGSNRSDTATSTGYFIERSSNNLFQGAGILSPGPASLPRIQTDCLFSPITSRGTFFNDLSPYQHQHQHQHLHQHLHESVGIIDDHHQDQLINSPHFTITTNNIISHIHDDDHSIDLFNHFFHY